MCVRAREREPLKKRADRPTQPAPGGSGAACRDRAIAGPNARALRHGARHLARGVLVRPPFRPVSKRARGGWGGATWRQKKRKARREYPPQCRSSVASGRSSPRERTRELERASYLTHRAASSAWQEKADTLLQRAHRLALAGPRMLHHPDSADTCGQLLLPVPTVEVRGMMGWGSSSILALSLASPSLFHASVCLPSAAPCPHAACSSHACMCLPCCFLSVCLSVLISCLPPLSVGSATMP